MPARGLADSVTPGPGPAAFAAVERSGVLYGSATWTAPEVASLMAHLGGRGAAALDACSDAELLAAWKDAAAAFRDPRSPERERLDPALARLTALSPAGLAAGLEAVLGGVAGVHAAAAFERAGGRRQPRPALVVLAGNLPGLAVQPLLPALALRRPLLLESASAEPLFAPAFVEALRRRLPAIGEGVAAVTWRGGDEALEAPVLAAAGRVLVYGGAEAVASLRRRAPGRVVDYGPKLSVAVVGDGVDLAAVARGLARDVALFDQRGCLSVQAVLVAGVERARALAEELGRALAAAAVELPPGPAEPAAAARVQALRAEAAMWGLPCFGGALAAGTVILDPRGEVLPSPGLRTVRVLPLAAVEDAPGRLAPWRGLLQGAALAGDGVAGLGPELERLGVSRRAAPGELQAADAAWHNGGRDPLDVLAEA